MQNLTRGEVVELRETLESVPKTKRGDAWVKATRFLDHILSEGSNLAIREFADKLHYSVPCTLCHRLIAIGTPFVSLDEGYRHYDCNMARAEEHV